MKGVTGDADIARVSSQLHPVYSCVQLCTVVYSCSAPVHTCTHLYAQLYTTVHSSQRFMKRAQGNRNVPNTEARNTFRERSEHLQLTMCEKRFQRFCEKRFSALM